MEGNGLGGKRDEPEDVTGSYKDDVISRRKNFPLGVSARTEVKKRQKGKKQEERLYSFDPEREDLG